MSVSKPATTTNIVGLSDGVTYNFKVKSVDTSANKSVSVDAEKYIGTPTTARADATGGVTTFVNNGNGTWDEVHTFATRGPALLTLNKGPVNAKVLVVGGGGNGGSGTNDAGGGGGGAGGVLYQASYTLSSNNINLKVGGTIEESWLGSVNDLFAESGGNGGDAVDAPYNYQGGNGGSSGGTKINSVYTNGNGGGQGYGDTYSGAGGGGGGAGGGGQNGDAYSGGVGGAGVDNAISGTKETYGRGAGGGGTGGQAGGFVTSAVGTTHYGDAGQQGVVIVRWNWID
ncbi:hypothetical protein AGMMS50212_11580 [Spirochaetia bacterium]|nr:hypothetical protein AGMMS50212_11580 [Spirochaetia bacterium]